MHTHKINSTSQEYQNFLAQNRKDPITGDSIAEGDEVVFCASCKSVFLRETWEYLGGRHCEQSETLIEFPLRQTIQVKVDNEILFYKQLDSSGENKFEIPNKAKQIPWVYQEKFLSSYDEFQESNLYTGLVVFLFCFSLPVMSFFTDNYFILLSGIVMAVLLFIVRVIHDSYYIKKVNLKYKKFSNNTFYISKKSISFATKYGKKHYTLSAKCIEKLIFSHTGYEFENNYCKIFYKIEGINKVENVICYLSNDMLTDPFSLFDALHTFSKNKDIQIEIESIQEDTIMHLEALNKRGNTNFAISCLPLPHRTNFLSNLFL